MPAHGPYSPGLPATGGNTSKWPFHTKRGPGRAPFHSATMLGLPGSFSYTCGAKPCRAKNCRTTSPMAASLPVTLGVRTHCWKKASASSRFASTMAAMFCTESMPSASLSFANGPGPFFSFYRAPGGASVSKATQRGRLCAGHARFICTRAAAQPACPLYAYPLLCKTTPAPGGPACLLYIVLSFHRAAPAHGAARALCAGIALCKAPPARKQGLPAVRRPFAPQSSACPQTGPARCTQAPRFTKPRPPPAGPQALCTVALHFTGARQQARTFPVPRGVFSQENMRPRPPA